MRSLKKNPWKQIIIFSKHPVNTKTNQLKKENFQTFRNEIFENIFKKFEKKSQHLISTEKIQQNLQILCSWLKMLSGKVLSKMPPEAYILLTFFNPPN